MELIEEMAKIVRKGSSFSPIQLGILEDTWLAEFGHEIPESLLSAIKNVKKATC